MILIISKKILNFFKVEEIAKSLKEITDENCKSIDDLGVIHSVGFDNLSGTVSIKLNLTKDYRKAKELIQTKLQKIDWISKININMAPKE